MILDKIVGTLRYSMDTLAYDMEFDLGVGDLSLLRGVDYSLVQ